MKEIWKPIEGYEGFYDISNKGRVRSYYNNRWGLSETPKELPQHVSSHGYKMVNLTKKDSYKAFLVHRLVAEHFVDNPEDKRCVNHIDCDKFNNPAVNLEWVSYKENMSHAIDNGLYDSIMGSKNHNAKLNRKKVLEIRRIHKTSNITQQKIADMFGISIGHVNDIIHRKKWKHI